ncbi:cyclic pyranopterin monophosphate synthase MoaC [Desulfogranum japonicum]|uniref:cyclic pyranopterin monophosphate synthase MoaC n=1 Tax=Desulfogranum japonicum TaxID=231447 RepID=UPI00040D865E|nr:cyclic pyranopterin monophosphate synthase MoaC [Desulfogranum japonicum]
MVDKSPLTHFDDAGNARMVDVGDKTDTKRIATAKGRITMSDEAYALVKAGNMKKGDVLGVARIAGVMAAKKVDQLIPLCHPLALSGIDILFTPVDKDRSIDIEATVSITGKTGVEMEALTAVSVAALTIYDMCKAVDKTMEIHDIKLCKKSGGKSGTFHNPAAL